MAKGSSTFDYKQIPSLATTQHWHDLYAVEKAKCEQLERENEALRKELDECHQQLRMQNSTLTTSTRS